MSLSVRRNHDYTISVIDSKQKEITFRDIRGSDLEYLDSLLNVNESNESVLTFDHILDILSLLCVKDLDFRDLPRRVTIQIFQHIREQLLCNYMPKYDWLRRCYAIQNGSFAGVSSMEEMPMNKFVAMTQIHQDAIEAMGNNT